MNMKRLSVFGFRLSVVGRFASVVAITGLISACASQNGNPDAYGHIEATAITISAETAGVVLEVGPAEGEVVEAGALIARIDTTAIELRQMQLQAQRNAVDARLRSVDAQESILAEQLANIDREITRIGSLRDGGAATEKQADDLDGQRRVMLRQIEALDPQRASIRAEAVSIRAQLEMTDDQRKRSRILSPIHATVLNRLVEPGEFVAVGRPVMRLADLRVVTMRAYLSGDQLPGVRLGQEVVVMADAGEGAMRGYPGTVARIADRAEFTPRNLQTREDRVNFVYAVEIRVVNDGSLKIGMPAELRIK
jgi:HlyD family secretion protein